MVWKVLIVVLLVAIAVGIVVQHVVTETQTRTIAEVRSRRTTEGIVALQGTITFASANTFILDDGTGRVELSTCPIWFKRIDLQVGDHVIAIGEVMRNRSYATKSDFVLSTHKVLKGGAVIQVRGRPGKPPWASYRLPEASSVRGSEL